MDILRFITAGSVDDGKSTLIGRLLYDTGNIKSDVLESVAGGANKEINLAFITDGLRSERERGITIDVAYKYFTTKNRKYIITDAPGHFQYTRNLVTGASGVDVMIILIDAQNGITEQTRRHSLVASFLKIQHIVIAVNKMDAVGFDEKIFTGIKNEYLAISEKAGLNNLIFVPISALLGDNVTHPSTHMEWYKGTTLLQYLEACNPVAAHSDATMRLSIQYVIEGAENGYAGKILCGRLKAGDGVTIYPGAKNGVVKKILNGYHEVPEANAGENVCVYMTVGTGIERGNLITHNDSPPLVGNAFEATICWLDAAATLQPGKEYFLRIAAMASMCRVTQVLYKTDVTSFDQYSDNTPVGVNQFARVVIETYGNIACDPYAAIPGNGRGIIIDPETNYTSGALIIEHVSE